MKKITLENIKDIRAGNVVVYDNAKYTGLVVCDLSYVGGLSLNGRSVKNVLEEFNELIVVE